MAEIKKTFTAGRMNKDLDERLVPNGEYRDAQNIQVRTTDGDSAGTIQNLQGNIKVGETNKLENIIPNSNFSLGSQSWVDNNQVFFNNTTPNTVKIKTVNTQTRVLGPEAYPEGDYSSDPDNHYHFNTSWVSGAINYNANVTSSNSRPVFGSTYSVLDTTKTYEVKISCSVYEGRLILEFGGKAITLSRGTHHPNSTTFILENLSNGFISFTSDIRGRQRATVKDISIKEITGYSIGLNELKSKDKHLIEGESYVLNYDVLETSGQLDGFSFYNGKEWNPLTSTNGSHEHYFSYPSSSDIELKIRAISNSDSNAYIILDNITLKNTSELVSNSKCVGSVVDEKNDKAYFLFASEYFNSSNPKLLGSETKYIDYVIEQSSNGNTVNVVNDLFGIASTSTKVGVNAGNFQNNSTYSYFDVKDAKDYRPGMTVKFLTNDNVNLLEANTKISHIIENKVYLDKVQSKAVNTHLISNPTFNGNFNGWINHDSNQVLSLVNDDLKVTRVSGSTKFKTSDSIITQGGKYKLIYKIKEVQNVTKLMVWNGVGYVNIPHEVGTHEVTLEGSTESRLFFEVVVPNNGDYIIFESIFLYDYSTVPTVVTFESKKVLGLSQDNLITGINVIDDLIMWTDGATEPKKLNIKRSIAGTKDTKSHSQLYVNVGGELVLASKVMPLSYKNLISNPDFTSNTAGWTFSGGNSSLSSVGSKLRVTLLSSGEGFAQTRVNVEKGKSYRFEVDGYIQTANNAKLWVADGPLYSDQITSDGGLSLEFIATETRETLVRIYIDGSTSNYSDFDNASVTLISNNDDAYLEEKHVTVIKKAPKTAPVIDIKTFGSLGYEDWVFSHSGFFNSNTFRPFNPGSRGEIQDLPSSSKIKVGDTLLVRGSISGLNEVNVQIRVESIVDRSVYYVIISIDSNVSTNHTEWIANVSEPLSIFEDKFCRFAYRYKYNDGEYSPFSPWSKVAFEPETFDFKSNNGYNLGMVNQAKEIHVSGLVDYATQQDITSIELLFRDTSSNNVYILKEITKGYDPEWLADKVLVTSEIMHDLVPEDQSLRLWDNVPKQAKAQEVIGNRVVYGNYTEGYNLNFKPSIQHSINSEPISSVNTPNESIKSMRSYKVGVVFEDEYGRQTPVISTSDRSIDIENVVLNSGSGSTTVPKSNSNTKNKITVSQDWSSLESNSSKPDNWISSTKYYVKEDLSEYYNLVMDRWYNAEDGNIWLSFLSSDRNKINDDTYLHLKKTHGSDQAVVSDARYKVLAISNEAPDFIKTSNNVLGRINLPEVHYYEHVNGAQPRLTSSFDFDIDKTDYSAFNPSDEPIQAKGNLKVRLVAEITNELPYRTIATNYVDVNYFTQPASDNQNPSKLRLKEQFGDQANFYQRFVDDYDEYTTTDQVKTLLESEYGGMYYELMDSVVQNKPEFDGKFFVKINRDEKVEHSVLSGGKVTNVLEITGHVGLSNIYTDINTSNGRSNLVNYSDYQWGDNAYGTYISGDLSVNPLGSTNNPDDWQFTSKIASCDYGNEGKTWWSWWDKYRSRYFSGRKYASCNLFIDGAPYVGSNGEQLNSGGLYQNEDAIDGTLNKIDICFPHIIKDIDQSQLLDIKSTQQLFSEGSIFSFPLDPNKLKYRVKKVDVTQRVSYKIPDQGCKDCDEVDVVDSNCIRNVYTLTFEVLNPNGSVTPNKGMDISTFDPRTAIAHDGTAEHSLEIHSSVAFVEDVGLAAKSNKGGVWETEPKELVDVDFYYEASNSIPMILNAYNVSDFAPLNSIVTFYENNSIRPIRDSIKVSSFGNSSIGLVSESSDVDFKVYGPNIGDSIKITHPDGTVVNNKILDLGSISTGDFVSSPRVTTTATVDKNSLNLTNVSNYADIAEGSYVYTNSGHFAYNAHVVTNNQDGTLVLNTEPLISGPGISITFFEYGGAIKLDPNAYTYPVELGWFNCYSFGNGVESNRIRDDFNAPTIGNGFKVSTTFLGYGEEHKSNGLIYSNIYNPSSNVDGLSEFNMAYKITKDLNPSYGSIQALKTRDTNLNVFTEDKILKVLANKDALYNADGNTNVTSTDRVLGQAVPYVGDYGISKNPESLAHDQYRTYFTDKQRGAVLRLSMDGLTPISNVGMKTWFRDNLRTVDQALGSFDIVNGEYNLTIKNTGESHLDPVTVSFNEGSKGWVSFKSFIPDSGVSVSGKYITTNGNKIWEHYSSDVERNTFYEQLSIELVENGYFNTDLRGWEITSNAGGYASWSNQNPGVDSTALRINGLTDKSSGEVIQYLNSKTKPDTKYEVSFDYYIESGKLVLDLSVGDDNKYTLTNTGAWGTKSVVFDSSKNTFSSISFYGVSGHAAKAWVTNVSIKELENYFKPSEVTLLINDIPDTVKRFKNLNYSGSEGKVVNVNNITTVDAFGDAVLANDGLYSNLSGEPTDGYGWTASIKTDLDSGTVISFSEKEGRWFGQVVGDIDSSSIKASEVDQSSFSTQGLGFASNVTDVGASQVTVNITNF